MTAYLIAGGDVLLPGGLERADVRIEDGRIVEIGAPPTSGAVRVDATGLLTAPAMVDIHGDAFERQVSPRPGVLFPLDVALLDTDRQLAAHGVATAYHALTLSWEPGLRSVEQGRRFVAALREAEAAGRLRVEHRLQLRWETFCLEAIPFIEAELEAEKTPTIAFNDHTSMGMRRFETPVTERAFEQSPAFETVDPRDPRMVERIGGLAKRSGLTADGYIELQAEIWSRRPEVGPAIEHIAAAGRNVGAPMLSHDDTQHETRDYYRRLGARIAEFPMREPVARAAVDAGDWAAFGAPNVVRGGSHIGAVSAADMVEAGLCSALASDYAYPAMMAAADRLLADKRGDLSRVWSCVSSGPAAMLGLDDRGEIAVGKRADLVVMDWPRALGRGDAAPKADATFSAGRLAHLGADLLA